MPPLKTSINSSVYTYIPAAIATDKVMPINLQLISGDNFSADKQPSYTRQLAKRTSCYTKTEHFLLPPPPPQGAEAEEGLFDKQPSFAEQIAGDFSEGPRPTQKLNI